MHIGTESMENAYFPAMHSQHLARQANTEPPIQSRKMAERIKCYREFLVFEKPVQGLLVVARFGGGFKACLP